MEKYSYFINQIPDKVLQNSQIHLFTNIGFFKSKSYITEPMTTTDYHFMLPSENLSDVYYNGKFISLDTRKILAINPGDITYCSKSAPAKPFVSFMIKSELLHRVAEEMGFIGTLKLLKSQNAFSSELIQVIRNFDREANRPDNLVLMMDCLEMQIAALILREFKTNLNLKDFPVYSTGVDSYIRLAAEYIHTYFGANITIEDICSEIHVSTFHFIRMFKQKTGISPHRYLLNVRIKKAEELLSTRRYSVSEVARLCGFVSIPHFSATFKEMTGYSPGGYQKKYY